MAPKKKTNVRFEDLCYYFDAVERDRLDTAGTSRKSSEILALRERLLKLPESEFDAAIKTVKTLVDETAHGDEDDKGGRGQRARQLYDQTRPGSRGGSGGKTSKVSAT